VRLKQNSSIMCMGTSGGVGGTNHIAVIFGKGKELRQKFRRKEGM
jgi:hypothetical protein